MSTSLLYHAFGIRGYQYVATDYREGGVQFRIAKELKGCRCSACGSNHVASRGQVERQFQCADRPPPRHRRLADPAGLVPQLRRHPPGQAPLRRPTPDVHACFERYALELSGS